MGSLLAHKSRLKPLLVSIFFLTCSTGAQEDLWVEPSPSDLPASTSEDSQLPAVVFPLDAPPPGPDSTEDLARQVAELSQRLEALEYPPVKYPAHVQLLGVFQADGVAFNQDAANRDSFGYIENGADFRRARLAGKAELAPTMNAFFQMEFAFPGRPTFADVWVEWTDLPRLGTVRVGQWKHPFSLEVVSSFRYTTFMERSSLFQAFTPFRHLGVGFYNHSDDLMATWAASYFRTGQDQFGGSLSTTGGNGVAGRLTQLAWYDDSSLGRSYMHLGGAYYWNSPPRHVGRFRSIPEMFVGENSPGAVGTAGFPVPGAFNGTPFFVDTGVLLDTEHIHTFGLEALLVHGPLSIQAEAVSALVDQEASPAALLGGAYVQVGWFLTGEHRPYDRTSGAIDRVRPFEDFFLVRTDRGIEGGWGAWELATRYSHIDLNDESIQGGRMDNLTAGVNWYCNPYSKVVFNYVHSWVTDRNDVPSEANSFALRAQMDF
jgi:phosphate-selective porin OprO/OprP